MTPVLTSDIRFRRSAPSGPGNTVFSSNISLGGWMAVTEHGSGLHELFDPVTSGESLSGKTEYRCLFVYNNHASTSLLGTKIWIVGQTTGGATCEIGLDPAGVVAASSGIQQSMIIADENTAPGSVIFSAAADEVSALIVGTLPADHCFAFWIKRIVPIGAFTLPNDSVTVRVKGSSA